MKDPFLSIIVPFHNSAGTCQPLLQTLRTLDDKSGVEVILVDDGSTDETLKLLNEFAAGCRANVRIVERLNGGPGAARNSGLERASGLYVWFVDSDDDIDLGAIDVATAADWEEVDLIVWGFEHPKIESRLCPGIHTTNKGPAPPDVLDPIVANWLSMSFLKRTRLRFPEYCFYEATPLEAFVLPLLVDTYVKSEFPAYRANVATPSITRTGGFNPGHYDRLATVSMGRQFVEQATLAREARSDFDEAFIRLFLWYSIDLSKIPGASWLRAARVMRKFRDEARRFQIGSDPWSVYPGRWHSKLAARAIWLISALLPSQDQYFDRLHMTAWGRPIEWRPPSPKPPRVTQPLPDEAGARNSLPAPARS